MSFLDQVKAWSTTAPSLPDLEATDLESGQLVERGADNFEQTATAGRSRIKRGLELNDVKYRGKKVSRQDIFGDSNEVGNLEPVGNKSDDDEGDDDDEGEDDDDDEDEKENEDVISDGSDIDDPQFERAQDEEDEFSGEEALEQLQLSRGKTLAQDSGSDVDDEEGDFDEEDEYDDEEDDDEEEDGMELDGEKEGDDEEEVSEGENGLLAAKKSKLKVKELVKSTDNDQELKQANDVADQLKIWDQTLFLKIKLQAAMRAFNKLPRGDLAKELLASADEETKKNFKKARSNIKHMLLELLNVEKCLVDGNAKSKGVLEGLVSFDDPMDEEIESSEDEKDDSEDEDNNVENEGENDLDDEEDEGDEADDEEEEEDVEADNKRKVTNLRSKKAMNFKEVEATLKEREANYSKFRSETIRKWDARTKLTASTKKVATGDFTGFLKDGIVDQIKNLMKDTEKQTRKFHIKRAEGDRIGGDEDANVDEEVFDDDDFNETLMKELIDKKSKTISDPIAMTRHYIEMKKLQDKRSRKRKYDRAMVKDRSIKYVPIPALLNFHPARPEVVKWSHEARNELYKSLFQ